MREHRVIVITLFAMLQAAAGCNKRIISVVSVSPDAMYVAPKAGDVLSWKIPNDQIETITLWIPTGLCDPDPQGTRNSEGNIRVTVTKDHSLECKVARQANSTPISYYYDFDITPKPDSVPLGLPKAPPPPIIMVIPSSCVGCKAVHGAMDTARTNGTNDPTQPQRIECDPDPKKPEQTLPYVVNGSHENVPTLEIPSNIPSAAWNVSGNGKWTVTFTKPSPPLCSNLQLVNDNYVLSNSSPSCTISSGARGHSYTYTITLDKCSIDNSSEGYQLVLDSVPGTKPQ
jgi:hypothetical protein